MVYVISPTCWYRRFLAKNEISRPILHGTRTIKKSKPQVKCKCMYRPSSNIGKLVRQVKKNVYVRLAIQIHVRSEEKHKFLKRK